MALICRTNELIEHETIPPIGKQRSVDRIIARGRIDQVKSFRISCLTSLVIGLSIVGCQTNSIEFDDEAAPLSAVLHQLDHDLIGLALMLYYASVANREGEYPKMLLEQDIYLKELDVTKEEWLEILEELSKRMEELGEVFEERVNMPACAMVEHQPRQHSDFDVFLPDAVSLASLAVELKTINSDTLDGGLAVPLGVSGQASRKEINTTLIKTELEAKSAFFVFASWVDQYDRAVRQLKENPNDQAAQDTMTDLFRLSPLAVELFCAINASLSESFGVFVPVKTTIEVSFQVQKSQSASTGFDIAVVSGQGKAELSTDRVNKFIAEIRAVSDETADAPAIDNVAQDSPSAMEKELD